MPGFSTINTATCLQPFENGENEKSDFKDLFGSHSKYNESRSVGSPSFFDHYNWLFLFSKR